MKYPSMTVEALDQIGDARLAGANPDLFDLVKWVGSGEEIDLQRVRQGAVKLADDLREFGKTPEGKDKDQFEGRASVELFEALSDVGLLALDDPGFWRWVSADPFWWLAVWRENGAFQNGWESFRKYVDGRSYSECVALRMFTRGRLVTEAGDPSLAHAVPAATDLWRSHIVRVKTGYRPELAAAVVRQQKHSRMPTDELRAFARRLNRLSSNVVLDLYSAAEADEILGGLRA